jgi:glycosyltransferase involved in cell wall biosynthesis
MVTAVIPARDAAATIAAAVRSVLEEHHPGLELVVVDDGSEDDTSVRAASAGAHRVVRRVAPGGPAAARNTGVQESDGDLVAFLDADDLWVTGRLGTLLRALAATGSAGVVGACRFVDLPRDERDRLGWSEEGDVVAVVPSLGAAIFRRSALDAVGPLDEELVSHEDYDLFLRMGDAGFSVATVDAVVTEVRFRRGSLSRQVTTVAGLPSVLARSARRRRRSATTDDVSLPRWGPVSAEASP